MKKIMMCAMCFVMSAVAAFAGQISAEVTTTGPNGEASGNTANYTAYLCTVEAAKTYFGGQSTVTGVTGWLEYNYETGIGNLKNAGDGVKMGSYGFDAGEYSFTKHYTDGLAGKYLAVIAYAIDGGENWFRVFGGTTDKDGDLTMAPAEGKGNAGAWTTSKKAYKLTLPPVAHASAKVTVEGAVVADLTKIPTGTTVTVTWTAASGYVITSGEVETIVMSGNKTAKAPVVEKYTPPTPPDPPTPVDETVTVSLPAGIAGGWYVVSNLTDGVEIMTAGAMPGGASYKLPVGKKVGIYVVPAEGYEIVEGTNPLIIDPVTKTTVIAVDMLPQVVPIAVPVADFRLYPEGDGVVFVPAARSTEQFLGTVLSTNGVEGTITVKMTKPNKKTGLFNLSATVKTLVDKQSYSFMAKSVSSFVDGPLTVELTGTSKKAKEHTLIVKLEGDSLTGRFDGNTIDGAKQVFAITKHPKRDAILPFVGTWTGAFTHPLATMEDVTEVLSTYFSAKLSKSGSASVKVYFPDGKTASCSAKAEVGADGVVAVPVTVWRSVKGVTESFGFRLVFAVDADDNLVCEVVDLTPVRDWTKKTGETVVADELEFLAAGLQTVTAKEFKTFAIAVDQALEELVGPVEKNTLSLAASTGRITGSLKWKVPYVDAKGREKTKSVSGKAAGIMVGGVGVGTVTVKLDGVTSGYGFTAVPVFYEPGSNYMPTGKVICIGKCK